jgi:hypothetical protein
MRKIILGFIATYILSYCSPSAKGRHAYINTDIVGKWQSVEHPGVYLVFTRTIMYQIYQSDTVKCEYAIKRKPCDESFSNQKAAGYLVKKLDNGLVLCNQISSIDNTDMQLINPGNGIMDNFTRLE